MTQAQDDLVARASDPNAELATLHELANNYPGLRPYIAANPRTYPSLLEWLGSLGDPAVDAALARRNQAAQTVAVDPATARAAAMGGAAGTAAGAGGIDAGPPTESLLPAAIQQQYQQPAAQQPTQYQQPTTAQYQQSRQRPAAEEMGVFGVGAAAPESDRPRRSGLWLWVLGGIVLVSVVALIVWFMTSGDPETSSTAPTTTQQSQAAPEPTNDQAAEASETATPTPSATPTRELLAPAPEDALELSSFTSPSGNITCVLGDDSVSCTINEHNFVPTDASCGNASTMPFTVSVGADGQATGNCNSDFSAAGATLNYEATAASGDFACTVAESGVECWSQVSGEGFRLSREQADTTTR
ncbi:MAG: hypothetical protein Q4C85_09380 [Actinomyces sp.]|uniref:variant leucine-rich repeat-containing protein n=1 Tax=Actinomyces sp. TaxID=29317 RepID=UPI0026DBED33|nr:hypothetical protein [Actinomyces sp.]MDO4243949.1 hypothetical protein [Actinomyces sp.]